MSLFTRPQLLQHPDFKWRFIATLPNGGGLIDSGNVLKWIESR